MTEPPIPDGDDTPSLGRCGIGLHAARDRSPEPDAILALVGGNGAGKSTRVKLLLRFYDPGTVAPTTTPLNPEEPPRVIRPRLQIGKVRDAGRERISSRA